MIVNQIENETEKALRMIAHAQTNFYQTGSRYFGNATENSDYDFFAEYTDKLYNSLLSCGFSQEEYAYAEDPNTACVLYMGNVHVQLIKDINKKIRIQECIKEEFRHWFNKMDKETQRALWSMLYVLIRD